MVWARFDDHYWSNPKFYRLGKDRLAGIGLHACAVTWSSQHLTDGIIPESIVTQALGGHRGLADGLVRAGLWFYSAERGEYLINDYLDYNPSRSQVESRRDAWRDRQGKSRGVSRRDTARDTQRDTARDQMSPVPVPVPDTRFVEQNGTGRGESEGGRRALRSVMEGIG
jgi:hypothetical protein